MKNFKNFKKYKKSIKIQAAINSLNRYITYLEKNNLPLIIDNMEGYAYFMREYKNMTNKKLPSFEWYKNWFRRSNSTTVTWGARYEFRHIKGRYLEAPTYYGINTPIEKLQVYDSKDSYEKTRGFYERVLARENNDRNSANLQMKIQVDEHKLKLDKEKILNDYLNSHRQHELAMRSTLYLN